MKITQKEFEMAQTKMNEVLASVTIKGGFDNLTKKENSALAKYTKIVQTYEEENYIIQLHK